MKNNLIVKNNYCDYNNNAGILDYYIKKVSLLVQNKQISFSCFLSNFRKISKIFRWHKQLSRSVQISVRRYKTIHLVFSHNSELGIQSKFKEDFGDREITF